jgi:hypothetical protein
VEAVHEVAAARAFLTCDAERSSPRAWRDSRFELYYVSHILAEVAEGLKQLGVRTERLSRIAQPTGLALSVTTLRNLHKLLTGVPVPVQQIDPESCDEDVFGEILDVTPEVALALWMFFNGRGPAALDDVQGMTPKLVSDVRQHFKMGEGAAAAAPSST